MHQNNNENKVDNKSSSKESQCIWISNIDSTLENDLSDNSIQVVYRCDEGNYIFRKDQDPKKQL